MKIKSIPIRVLTDLGNIQPSGFSWQPNSPISGSIMISTAKASIIATPKLIVVNSTTNKENENIFNYPSPHRLFVNNELT